MPISRHQCAFAEPRRSGPRPVTEHPIRRRDSPQAPVWSPSKHRQSAQLNPILTPDDALETTLPAKVADVDDFGSSLQSPPVDLVTDHLQLERAHAFVRVRFRREKIEDAVERRVR